MKLYIVKVAGQYIKKEFFGESLTELREDATRFTADQASHMAWKHRGQVEEWEE